MYRSWFEAQPRNQSLIHFSRGVAAQAGDSTHFSIQIGEGLVSQT